MFTCAFCQVIFDEWQENCPACGAAMPPPDDGLGPPPGPPPRRYPRGYLTRQWFSQNFEVVFGLAFSFAGGVIFTLFALNRTWFALIPGFFLLGGVSALCRGLARASRVTRAFRHGLHVEGQVVSIEKDPAYTGMKAQGSYQYVSPSGERRVGSHRAEAPWILKYRFTLNGVAHEGQLSTFESSVNRRRVGDRIWVLYLPKKPGANSIYPPLL